MGGILTWADDLQGVPVHAPMLGPDKAAVIDTPNVARPELRDSVSIPQVVLAAFQASERPRLPPPQCECIQCECVPQAPTFAFGGEGRHGRDLVPNQLGCGAADTVIGAARALP